MPTSELRAPDLTRPSRRGRRVVAGLLALVAAALLAAPGNAGAQRPDSTRADSAARPGADTAAASRPARRPARRAATDTTPRPPISPRRAFLSSLAFPGLGQTKLGRPNAAAIFATVEAVALLMARKSALDLRTARYGSTDSVVVSFQTDPTTGEIKRDSLGNVLFDEFVRPNALFDRVSARRTHYEDWIALLLFNHFFAGADAFVAAQLWDLPAQVGFRPAPGGLSLVATLRFR